MTGCKGLPAAIFDTYPGLNRPTVRPANGVSTGVHHDLPTSLGNPLRLSPPVLVGAARAAQGHDGGEHLDADRTDAAARSPGSARREISVDMKGRLHPLSRRRMARRKERKPACRLANFAHLATIAVFYFPWKIPCKYRVETVQQPFFYSKHA